MVMQVEWQGETVTKVEPANGAAEVHFSWSDAQDTLDKLSAMAEGLGAEYDDRAGMAEGGDGDAGMDWVGPFRDEFDAADGVYVINASYYKGQLLAIGDDIFDHAVAVVAEQEAQNGEAGEEGAA